MRELTWRVPFPRKHSLAVILTTLTSSSSLRAIAKWRPNSRGLPNNAQRLPSHWITNREKFAPEDKAASLTNGGIMERFLKGLPRGKGARGGGRRGAAGGRPTQQLTTAGAGAGGAGGKTAAGGGGRGEAMESRLSRAKWFSTKISTGGVQKVDPSIRTELFEVIPFGEKRMPLAAGRKEEKMQLPDILGEDEEMNKGGAAAAAAKASPAATGSSVPPPITRPHLGVFGLTSSRPKIPIFNLRKELLELRQKDGAWTWAETGGPPDRPFLTDKKFVLTDNENGEPELVPQIEFENLLETKHKICPTLTDLLNAGGPELRTQLRQLWRMLDRRAVSTKLKMLCDGGPAGQQESIMMSQCNLPPADQGVTVLRELDRLRAASEENARRQTVLLAGKLENETAAIKRLRAEADFLTGQRAEVIRNARQALGGMRVSSEKDHTGANPPPSKEGVPAGGGVVSLRPAGDRRGTKLRKKLIELLSLML